MTTEPTRIKSVSDARGLLGNDEPHADLVSEVRAIAVVAPETPEVVADFAVRIALTREGKRLHERTPGDPIRRGSVVNLWWIAYGSIVRACDGGLIMGSLMIAPYRECTSATDDVALGVTGELLRAIKPGKIVADAVAYLRATEYEIDKAERGGYRPLLQEEKRRVYETISKARTRRAPSSDAEIELLAKRYVSLFRSGNRRPTSQLAGEFRLTNEQVRDRIHRARKLQYLAPTKQGRGSAQPGPKLEPWREELRVQIEAHESEFRALGIAPEREEEA